MTGPAALLLQADARALPIRDGTIQCVVTSPPYFGLRDYGVAGQIGLESTPEEYVAHLVVVFREVRRVLRDDATLWLNLGDSYASGEVGRHDEGRTPTSGPAMSGHQASRVERRISQRTGLKPKDLVGIPWRVAFALQADGWYLRSDIVWSKPNPMPESVTDRPTKAHEYLFLLSKRARYFYDAKAVAEPLTPSSYTRMEQPTFDQQTGGPKDGLNPNRSQRRALENLAVKYRASGNKERKLEVPTRPYDHRGSSIPWEAPTTLTRNRRTVWTIATQPYPEAHFATFPEALVEPCILAGTSERGACQACGAPWARVVERPSGAPTFKALAITESGALPDGPGTHRNLGARHQKWLDENPAQTTGWSPTCPCPPAEPVPCRVLDPFGGSGTTAAVAERLGRIGVAVELKPEYLALARKRTVQAGLL